MPPSFYAEAAVAAIVVRQPVPELLVVKRRDNPEDPWSGHYAFPGGRRDNSDSSLLTTCIRETREECGIRLAPEGMVKRYPVLRAGNRLRQSIPVAAYLFALETHPEIQLQRAEISCYEWIDLDYLSDSDNTLRRPLAPGHPDLFFPCIPVTEGFIWGFTYEVLMLVLKDLYPYGRAAEKTAWEEQPG